MGNADCGIMNAEWHFTSDVSRLPFAISGFGMGNAEWDFNFRDVLRCGGPIVH